ncbi:MAG: hypothetical protein ACXVRK_07060 [Gaiellaceae bacterium]
MTTPTTSAYATTLSRFELGDMVVEYLLAVDSQTVGLRAFPASMSERVVARREFLGTHEIELLPEFMRPIRAWLVEPLVQVKLAGDAVDGFSQGLTMRNSRTLASLRYAGQETTRSADVVRIVTTMRSDRGYACEHRLRYREGELALTIDTVFLNECERPLSLELLASFALSGLTPFVADDAPDRLHLHRFRSTWSRPGASSAANGVRPDSAKLARSSSESGRSLSLRNVVSTVNATSPPR